MLKVSLRSRALAAAFLALVIAAGLLLIAQAARLAAAAEWTASDDPERVTQALRLDPQNALVHNRLGFLLLRQASDASAALPHLRRATELNPRVAVYWIDLGNGCELAGQLDCARASYERAVALAPLRPDFTWDLANYYLRAGEDPKALEGFAQYLRFVPESRDRTFSLLYRGIHDPDLVWRKVVRTSGDDETELYYLTFLRKQTPPVATGPFWNELIAERKALPLDSALRYLDQLLEGHEYAEAQHAWSGLQAAGAVTARPANGNLIFNSNFEQKPLNGGFDWRFKQQAFLDMEFMQSGSCKEGHCLYLNFAVPQNSEYEPVYQIVPVKPGHSYSLSAFMRSQDIKSDSGPRLRVVDPECLTCLDVMTPPVLETTPWHKVELTFATGPKTQAVKISVWRPRSRVFPMEISGEFWLDSVSLTPAGEGVVPSP